jgi:dTDP-4-dehydrorhamnose reductase
MKLLVFGKTGQVARELQRLAPDATYLGRDEADLPTPPPAPLPSPLPTRKP